MKHSNEDHLDRWIEECLEQPAREREPEPQDVERIATALQIALTAPKMSLLPQSLRAKLEEQAREFTAGERERPKLRSVSGGVEPLSGGSNAWFAWTAAAASLLFAIWTLTAQGNRVEPQVAQTTVEQRDELLASGSELLTLDWTATEDPAAVGASGSVVWSDDLQEGYMTFRSLEANNPTEAQYQLWIFDPERPQEHPVDGGVFDVPAGASEVVVSIDPKLNVRDPSLFAVTVEKPGGVVVSSRERIVLLAQ